LSDKDEPAKMITTSSNLEGISFLTLAMLTISTQSIAVKWLGGSYPVLEDEGSIQTPTFQRSGDQ
jgi:hypothetical protein